MHVHGISPQPKPRYHFDYFYSAMLTTFIVFTGEWVDAMMDAVGAVGPSACAFFVAAVIFGSFILMNLLVTIVLEAFAEKEGDDDAPPPPPPPAPAAAPAASLRPSRATSAKGARAELIAKSKRTPALSPPAALERGDLDEIEAPADDYGAGDARLLGHEPPPPPPGGGYAWPRDYSLCCLPPSSAVRRACASAVAHPAFENGVSLAIVGASVALALDSPRLDPASALGVTLVRMDVYLERAAPCMYAHVHPLMRVARAWHARRCGWTSTCGRGSSWPRCSSRWPRTASARASPCLPVDCLLIAS